MTPSSENTTTPVRMKEVAEHAGVSRMTASAVLMGTGAGRIRVSESTAERVKAAALELGYRPNQAARQLAGKRSNVVALVVNDLHNYFAQKVLSVLHQELQADGLRLLTATSGENLESMQQILQDAAAGWVDGVVYLAHDNEAQWSQAVKILKGQKNAVTILGDSGLTNASIVSDVRPGAMATIDHLVGRGRKRIILLTEENESKAIRTRIEAYTEAMANHGLKFDTDQILVRTKGWYLDNPEYNERFEGLAREIVTDLHADALICDNDFAAAGMARTFRRLKIKVPDDIAIIGWGDLQFAAIYDPPLTTVTDDLTTILKTAVKFIHTETSTQNSSPTLIPTTLKIRETT